VIAGAWAVITEESQGLHCFTGKGRALTVTMSRREAVHLTTVVIQNTGRKFQPGRGNRQNAPHVGAYDGEPSAASCGASATPHTGGGVAWRGVGGAGLGGGGTAHGSLKDSDPEDGNHRAHDVGPGHVVLRPCRRSYYSAEKLLVLRPSSNLLGRVLPCRRSSGRRARSRRPRCSSSPARLLHGGGAVMLRCRRLAPVRIPSNSQRGFF
jgi:hypothetical protein